MSARPQIEVRRSARRTFHNPLPAAVGNLVALLTECGVGAEVFNHPSVSIVEIDVSDTPEGRAIAALATRWCDAQDGVRASLVGEVPA